MSASADVQNREPRERSRAWKITFRLVKAAGTAVLLRPGYPNDERGKDKSAVIGHDEFKDLSHGKNGLHNSLCEGSDGSYSSSSSSASSTLAVD